MFLRWLSTKIAQTIQLCWTKWPPGLLIEKSFKRLLLLNRWTDFEIIWFQWYSGERPRAIMALLFLHTFWFTTFDFQSRTCCKVTLFPLKSFYSSLKRSTLPATAVRFFMLTSNLHKVTSFFDLKAVKTNVFWRRRYVTSYTTYAWNTRDFYLVLGER